MLSYISKWFDSTSNNNSGAYSFWNCSVPTSFIKDKNSFRFGFPVVFHSIPKLRFFGTFDML